jgi:hypothetical protein
MTMQRRTPSGLGVDEEERDVEPVLRADELVGDAAPRKLGLLDDEYDREARD